MVEVQRLWRVDTSANGEIDVRLTADAKGNHRVTLSHGEKYTAFDMDEARAVAQAILEACEIDAALSAELDQATAEEETAEAETESG